MKAHAQESHPVRLMIFTIVTVVIGLLIALGSPGCRNSCGRGHGLAEDLNNVRQIKFALDGFATDFEGKYPSEATGEKIVASGTGTSSSNDYFRQLFLAGETQSEAIFWVKNSRICTKSAPDDAVLQNGSVNGALVLESGDCHWAYVTGQCNTSRVDRVLVVEGFVPGTTAWDGKRIDHKVVALRIDGSAKALRMNRAGEVPDGFGGTILSPSARAWEGSKEDPRKLLVQPEPRKP